MINFISSILFADRMKSFPEIERLKAYIKKFEIQIRKKTDVQNSACFWVDFKVKKEVWEILVEDEYQDFNEKNQLVCLFLVFSSLEIHSESKDYLDWSKEMGLNAAELNYLDYYKSLALIYGDIEVSVGKIDSCISTYDYNLRTEIVQNLIGRKF